MDIDLNRRLFAFAVRGLKFTSSFPNEIEFKIIRKQLVKSSTSSGANYEEAQAASSRADFTNKIKISLREMRETNYWLRILQELGESDEKLEINELKYLVKESDELKKILGTIAKKSGNTGTF